MAGLSRRRYLALCGASAGLSGCSLGRKPPNFGEVSCSEVGTSEGEPLRQWPSIKFDSGLTAFTEHSSGVTGCPEINWAHRTEFENSGGVLATPSHIITCGLFPDSSTYALDPETGDVDWKLETDGGYPTIAHNTLYIANRDDPKSIQAYDPSTGDVRWKREVWIVLPVIPHQNRIIGVTGTGKVVALDPTSGETIWTTETASDPTPPPSGPAPYDPRSLAVGGDRVVVQTFESLVALDSASGEVIWRLDNQSTPKWVAVRNRTVIAVQKRELLAVDLKDGSTLWKKNYGMRGGGSFVGSPVVSPESVYIVGNALPSSDREIGSGPYLHSFALRSGTRDWTGPGDRVWGTPVASPNTIYIPGHDALIARSLDGGAERWRVPLEDDFPIGMFGQVALMDGKLFATAHGFGERNGGIISLS